MGSRHWARRAFIMVGLAAALAGCGDAGSSPTESPVTATAPTSAPEPSPTPSPLATAVPLPVMPPEMANNDAAGAEAATRYFVALADYVLATGDASQWTSVTDDDCVFCNSIKKSAAEIMSEEWHRSGGGLEVSGIEPPEGTQVEGFYLVVANITETPYAYQNSVGEVVEQSGGSSGTVTFGVQFSAGSWILIAAGDPNSEPSS